MVEYFHEQIPNAHLSGGKVIAPGVFKRAAKYREALLQIKIDEKLINGFGDLLTGSVCGALGEFYKRCGDALAQSVQRAQCLGRGVIHRLTEAVRVFCERAAPSGRAV